MTSSMSSSHSGQGFVNGMDIVAGPVRGADGASSWRVRAGGNGAGPGVRPDPPPAPVTR